jgi:CBS domain containing-hemolysin-like protein
MNTVAGGGVEFAALMLAVAMVAAVIARAARGARRHVLQELCRQVGRPERYDQINDSSEAIAFFASTVVVVATVAATVAVSGWASRWTSPTAGRAAAIAATAGWTGIVWVALVVVPVVVTRAAGPWIMVASWPAFRPLVGLLGPLVSSLARASKLLGRRIYASSQAGVAAIGSELKMAVDEAHREGRLEAGARAMLEGVIDLDDVRVGGIMTTRTGMVTIPLSMPWEEIVRVVSESGHTRIPVWDKSPDDVVGILHSRELLVELCKPAAERRTELRPLLRPPYFVPESKSVLKLLREFQRTCTHLAVVTDEFGGVAGLVTIEDALEEIVGEIADEHDDAVSDGIRTLSPDSCEVRAQVPISELNERMGLRLPEETDFETVGGFVFHHAGRIPQPGERIEVDGVVVEVLSATRNRIDWVRVERRRGDGDPG